MANFRKIVVVRWINIVAVIFLGMVVGVVYSKYKVATSVDIESVASVAVNSEKSLNSQNSDEAFSVSVLATSSAATSSKKAGNLSEKSKSAVTKNSSGYRIIDLTIGNTNFKTEVAETDSQKQLGLSNRIGIGADQAMLFIFDKSGIYSFWMKDMNFAIDMIWINDQKKIVHIEKAVRPDSFPKSFQSEVLAKYVLEVQENVTVNKNIKVGDSVSF